MYNPIGNHPLDSDVSTFFQDHGIILAFVRDEDKIQKLREALQSLDSNTPIRDAVIAQIFAIGISFQRPILLELAKDLDCWNSPLIKNNPVWVEYIYEKCINSTDGPSQEVFDCLLRAAKSSDTEMIADLIHLGLVDKDAFEDVDKKMDRVGIAIKTYLRLCENTGVSRHRALDMICEAICSTNVIYNRKYAEPFVKLLDSQLRDYVPSFEFVNTIASQSGIDKSDIPFYKQSYLAVLNKTKTTLNADEKRMLMTHLPFFPDETFAFIKWLPLRVLTSPAFTNVLENTLHGEWLNNAIHLEKPFKAWVEIIVKDDYFASTRLLNPEMRNCSGECASMITCQIIEANGEPVVIADDREAQVSHLILKNQSKAGISDLSIYADALKSNSVARSMIRAYNKIAEVNHEDANVSLTSNEQKIQFMACNLLAEMYYMKDKNKPVNEKTPFHQAMKIRDGSGNKLYSHDSHLRIILSEMKPESMLEHISEPAMRRSFLIFMLKNKDIPMSFATKLKPVDRRALLEKDFEL